MFLQLVVRTGIEPVLQDETCPNLRRTTVKIYLDINLCLFQIYLKLSLAAAYNVLNFRNNLEKFNMPCE